MLIEEFVKLLLLLLSISLVSTCGKTFATTGLFGKPTNNAILPISVKPTIILNERQQRLGKSLKATSALILA